MTKVTITATFSNGETISRKSVKQFPFAWISSNKWNTSTGFSSSRKAAETAAKNYYNFSESKTQFWEVVETSI